MLIKFRFLAAAFLDFFDFLTIINYPMQPYKKSYSQQTFVFLFGI